MTKAAVRIFATLMFALSAFCVWIAVSGITTLGWWSLVIGFSGVTGMASSVMAFITGKSVWLIIELILPH